jgi:RNA polymerase sigma-70 factor (ECF subfamily)
VSERKDKRARFEAAAVPFLGSVYQTARRLGGPTDAADLVQETYLRAYRTFENFAPGTNCRAWLLKILYSVFVNRYRKERREPPMVAIDEEFERRIAGQSPEPATALGGLGHPDIDRALGELHQSLREAVLLVDVEELSYEEAAAALGCPVGTLRSRLFRGRKKLFLTLHGYAETRGLIKRPQGKP